jgi:hypothetical protein
VIRPRKESVVSWGSPAQQPTRERGCRFRGRGGHTLAETPSGKSATDHNHLNLAPGRAAPKRGAVRVLEHGLFDLVLRERLNAFQFITYRGTDSAETALICAETALLALGFERGDSLVIAQSIGFLRDFVDDLYSGNQSAL